MEQIAYCEEGYYLYNNFGKIEFYDNDSKDRIRLRTFIGELSKNKIVLIATHIVSDIEAIAKEIILMKKGTNE